MVCVGGRYITGFPGFALDGMSHEGFARILAADPFCMRWQEHRARQRKTAPEGNSGAACLVLVTLALRGDGQGWRGRGLGYCALAAELVRLEHVAATKVGLLGFIAANRSDGCAEVLLCVYIGSDSERFAGTVCVNGIREGRCGKDGQSGKCDSNIFHCSYPCCCVEAKTCVASFR